MPAHSALTGANLHLPYKTGLESALPATCAIGETFYATDTKKLYTATALNTWTVITSVSNGIKAGFIAREYTADAGDVATTGVGFQPAVIIFLSALGSGGANAYFSVGFDTAAARYCIENAFTDGEMGVSVNYSIALRISSTCYIYGKIKTFDADGFTITWSKSGTGSGQAVIPYLAFK